ncbi:MAG: GAF domain-containing protein [Lachnospiraceae bacterium]|nr:GAF domain-containing protein [Lachnospiraceae bacterium]
MILEKNVTARILEIARDLTQPTEYAMLLQKIINDAMDITNCDGGTLYIMQNGALAFMIMITRSKNFCNGGDGQPVNLPPVELNSTSVSAYVAREKMTKNIADVYNDVEFNWEGPKKYDALNGYHTQSELVVPLINHEQKVIGVLQLINAQDASGNVVAFSNEEQTIVEAISSLAAVSLSNRNMINQLQELLDSIALSFTDAIETRTKFNANHTRHVTEYCRGFADFLNDRALNGGDNITLSDNQKAQLIMAASLHDIGKLSVPLDLLNKSDRLDYRLKEMKTRWRWLLTDLKVKYHSGMIDEEQYKADDAMYREFIEYIEKVNKAPFLPDEDIEKIENINKVEYETSDGEVIDFITDEETHELCIRRGTLTAEERKEIEMHAVYTSKILEKITFGDKYDRVRFIAGAHHEALNGSGYPQGLTAKDLPCEVRILTIMDIFDSLTVADRPYKKPHDKEGAVRILREMVGEGKLDPELVELTAEYFERAELIV